MAGGIVLGAVLLIRRAFRCARRVLVEDVEARLGSSQEMKLVPSAPDEAPPPYDEALLMTPAPHKLAGIHS